MKDVLNVTKMEQNPLTNQKYTVIVSNPEVVNRGLFRFKYVEFTLETPEMKWKVRRRFSEFEILCEVLKRIFPGYLVPRLLHTKKGSRFEDTNKEKRKNFL